MLGTRGVRIGILYPDIYAMQVRAILLAAQAVHGRARARGRTWRSWCRSSPTSASSS